MTLRIPPRSLLVLLAFVGGCDAPSGGQAVARGNAVEAAPNLAPSNVAIVDNVAVEPAVVPKVAMQSPVALADDAGIDLPPSNEAANGAAFPAEVTAFLVDRDGCDHFRGEEPYDAERRAYLEQSIAELCTGTDAKLAGLRRRYAADKDVMAALGGYEERVEGEARP